MLFHLYASLRRNLGEITSVETARGPSGTRLEKIPALSKNKFTRGRGRFRKKVKSKVAQLLRDNTEEKLPRTKVNFPDEKNKIKLSPSVKLDLSGLRISLRVFRISTNVTEERLSLSSPLFSLIFPPSR